MTEQAILDQQNKELLERQEQTELENVVFHVGDVNGEDGINENKASEANKDNDEDVATVLHRCSDGTTNLEALHVYASDSSSTGSELEPLDTNSCTLNDKKDNLVETVAATAVAIFRSGTSRGDKSESPEQNAREEGMTDDSNDRLLETVQTIRAADQQSQMSADIIATNNQNAIMAGGIWRNNSSEDESVNTFSDFDNSSTKSTNDTDIETQSVMYDGKKYSSKVLESTAQEVRSHAFNLLQRMSSENLQQLDKKDRQKRGSSGNKQISFTTAASDSCTEVKQAKAFYFTKTFLIGGAIMAAILIALAATVGVLVTKSSNAPSNAAFNSGTDVNIATDVPTNPFVNISSTCETLDGRPKAQVWEAEDALVYIGDAVEHNTTTNTIYDITGYCGSGFVNGFSSVGSRYVLGHVTIPESGYYTLTLRYSSAAPDDQEIIVSFDSYPIGFLRMTPTGDDSLWMVESVTNILLKEGTHYIEVWTRVDHDVGGGPNIDWLALEQEIPLTRSEFITSILENEESYVMEEPTWIQNTALLWMADGDNMSWSDLSVPELIERFVLVQFYYSTYGEHWTVDDLWLSNSHVCQWFGVLCATNTVSFHQEQLVTDIVLVENGLFGVLPKHMFLLKELTDLSFNNNGIEGTISSDIGRIDKLSKLYLGGNFINGSIPSEIGSLSETLTVLILNDNMLTGSLPSGMGTLTNLKSLRLDGNSLTGTVPSSLSYLDITL